MEAIGIALFLSHPLFSNVPSHEIFKFSLIFKDILCPHARLGKNCVEMALKEFHEIKKIKKSGIDLFLNEYSQKRMDKSLVFVWAHNDRWADEWIRNNILDFLNPWIHGIEWIVSKKLKHSLIIRAPSEDIEGYFSRLLIKSIQKKLKWTCVSFYSI